MFSDTLRPMKENFEKRILAYLYCTTYNEINMFHTKACFVYWITQKISDIL